MITAKITANVTLAINSRIKGFFRRFFLKTDYGFLFVLFLTGFFLHTVYAFYMEVTIPDRAVFDLFDYRQGSVYFPVMWFFLNPFRQYAVMLTVNGILAALIPVTAYKIAASLGVQNVWHRVLAAVCAGICPAVIARTKFIWTAPFGNETLGFLFPMVIALIFLKAANTRRPVIRGLLSVAAAAVVLMSVFCCANMLAVAAAAILTFLFARFFLKKEVVSIAAFFISLVVFFGAVVYLTEYFEIQMPGVAGIKNLFGGFDMMSVRRIAGHLYYFAVSTWGLGILGLCFFIKNIRAPSNLTVFSAFAFLCAVFTLLFSALNNFGEVLPSEQEFLVFGRYIDGVTPLVLISIVCGISVYEKDSLRQINLRTILSAVIVLGIVFTAFFSLSSGMVVAAETVAASPILGLYPIRIGTDISSLITFDELFLMVSAVFCFMALFIVFVCCGGRYQLRIISLSIAAVSLYSCVYVCAVYLPYERNRAISQNAPVYEVSELLYDSEDAPPFIITPEVSGEAAALLQFLNQRATVLSYSEVPELPENYFLITLKNSADENNAKDAVLLATTDSYSVRAVGEKAVMYAASQN